MTLAFIVESSPNVFQVASVGKEQDGDHTYVEIYVAEGPDAWKLRKMIDGHRIFDVIISDDGKSLDLEPVEDWEELN